VEEREKTITGSDLNRKFLFATFVMHSVNGGLLQLQNSRHSSAGFDAGICSRRIARDRGATTAFRLPASFRTGT
jgi:hypothetical protein